MKTPLYEDHLEAGARMGPFAGWELPIQYEGILAEHHHTRRRASVFDTCHMGEFELSGPEARHDLERLLTLRVETLKTGRCRYGYLLRDDGGVLDDLTCYRRSEETFLLVVNAGTRAADADWIRARLSRSTRFADRSEDLAKLDVQGPASRPALEEALAIPVPELGYFQFAGITVEDRPWLISRTGYTGEWGYELYVPASEARPLWQRLLAPGTIRPAGLGARDTLRLEMGYALCGQDLSVERTPVGAGRGAFIDTGKDFIGRAAVLKELDQGIPQVLAGLRLESRQAARTHSRVFAAGQPVGEVTSGSLAPSLNRAVALAYLESNCAAPGQAVEIEHRGRRLPAEVVDLPFYRRGTARRKSVPGPQTGSGQ